MRTLVYIGEEVPAEAPVFVKPFQEKETEKQYTWEQVVRLMLTEGVTIRPAVEEEIEALRKNVDLITACTAYLGQFLDVSEREGV